MRTREMTVALVAAHYESLIDSVLQTAQTAKFRLREVGIPFDGKTVIRVTFTENLRQEVLAILTQKFEGCSEVVTVDKYGDDLDEGDEFVEYTFSNK